ncbi:hypothetical protein MNB_SUP05-SYMBIONT-4-95 [hydrothermal vent metagenome]|uniref:Uncharacterized protein n=1 Tax=hydrothermal vent metagenome TaxID=652676 RepID=A0A1W1DVR9_9ZZZZ
MSKLKIATIRCLSGDCPVALNSFENIKLQIKLECYLYLKLQCD